MELIIIWVWIWILEIRDEDDWTKNSILLQRSEFLRDEDDFF
jgi:hypothetical protein